MRHLERGVYFFSNDQSIGGGIESLLIMLRYAEVGGITFDHLIKPVLLIPQDLS